MRTVRNLAFLLLLGAVFWAHQASVAAQGGPTYCTTTWAGCRPSCMSSVPSCTELCQQAGYTFSGFDGPPGCGNAGAGDCQWDEAYLFKLCSCDCPGGGGGGGGCSQGGDFCFDDWDCCDGMGCVYNACESAWYLQ